MDKFYIIGMYTDYNKVKLWETPNIYRMKHEAIIAAEEACAKYGKQFWIFECVGRCTLTPPTPPPVTTELF